MFPRLLLLLVGAVSTAANAQTDAVALQARALAIRAQTTASTASTQASTAATTAQAASTKADAAATVANTAQSAVTALDGAVVKQVNGLAPTGGAVTLPIPTMPDLSGYAKTADVTAAIAAATASMVSTNAVSSAIASAIAPLATTSAVNAVAATVPAPCTVKPASDTTAGAVGTGTACTPQIDGSRATQVMPATAATLSDGTFSGSWPGTFASVPTTAFASAKTTTDPYTCQVATFTTTTFAGKCWKIVTMTLPSLATSLLGLVLSPYVNSPAGITVMVVGRQ